MTVVCYLLLIRIISNVFIQVEESCFTIIQDNDLINEQQNWKFISNKFV
jgi:hypothetical protein